jgi:hypothetical protein
VGCSCKHPTPRTQTSCLISFASNSGHSLSIGMNNLNHHAKLMGLLHYFNVRLLRQAQHEREKTYNSILDALVLNLLKDIFERKLKLVHVELNRSSGASERHGLPDNTTEQSEVCIGVRVFNSIRNPREPLVCSAEGHKTLCEKTP